MIKNKYFKEELIHDNYGENQIIEHLENIIVDVLKGFEKESSIDRKEALKALQLINLFCDAYDLEQIDLSGLSLISSSSSDFLNILRDYLDDLLRNHITLYNNPFLKQKSNLTNEQRLNIQELLNKLRDAVESEQNITEEHKRRILKKINEMQMELNKKISDLDYLGGKIMSILKGIKYTQEKIVSPLLKDATELAKAINRMESTEGGIPENFQIEYKYEETIETVETTEMPQIEDKSNK